MPFAYLRTSRRRNPNSPSPKAARGRGRCRKEVRAGSWRWPGRKRCSGEGTEEEETFAATQFQKMLSGETPSFCPRVKARGLHPPTPCLSHLQTLLFWGRRSLTSGVGDAWGGRDKARWFSVEKGNSIGQTRPPVRHSGDGEHPWCNLRGRAGGGQHRSGEGWGALGLREGLPLLVCSRLQVHGLSWTAPHPPRVLPSPETPTRSGQLPAASLLPVAYLLESASAVVSLFSKMVE